MNYVFYILSQLVKILYSYVVDFKVFTIMTNKSHAKQSIDIEYSRERGTNAFFLTLIPKKENSQGGTLDQYPS